MAIYKICKKCSQPTTIRDFCSFCESKDFFVYTEETTPSFDEVWKLGYVGTIEQIKSQGHRFDDVWYKKYRDQKDKERAIARRMSANEPPKIECPYCKSTDTKKISGTSRLLSVGFFGIGSGKVGKQWHCRKCSSDF